MIKTIPGWRAYSIDDFGTVYGRNGKPLTLSRSPKGYLCVTLYQNGRCKRYSVHRLVLETFVGPCPAGMQTRHLDGIRSNNRLSNLCWGTQKENDNDKDRLGTRLVGQQNGNAKITNEKARRIVEMKKRGGTKWGGTKLAEEMGITITTVSRIANGKFWKATTGLGATNKEQS
ncbi:HNH endonuclease signature motif containing protein [Achromobacter aegrifaciens]